MWVKNMLVFSIHQLESYKESHDFREANRYLKLDYCKIYDCDKLVSI